MEVRPIDANALPYVPAVVGDEGGWTEEIIAIPKSAVDAAPTLGYAPVRHGKWMPLEEPQWNCFGLVTIGYRCSECGREEPYNNEPYCHCGARMKEEVK